MCKCGCGSMISSVDSRGRPHNYKPGHQFNSYRGTLWSGGKYVHKGYVQVRTVGHKRAAKRGSYVPEHILIYEREYNCSMLEWGVVHHKDENRSNNDIINLVGMTKAAHTRLHRSKRQ